jgi:hypothetical protein
MLKETSIPNHLKLIEKELDDIVILLPELKFYERIIKEKKYYFLMPESEAIIDKIKALCDKVIELEDKVFKELDSPEYQIMEYEAGNFIGRGEFSEAYEVKDNKKLIMLMVGKVQNQDAQKSSYEKFQKIVEIHKKVPQGIHFARIIKVGIMNNVTVLICQRVPGKEIHTENESYDKWSENIGILANAPILHYQMLIRDIQTLKENGLYADPNKPHNFFYSSLGFYLINVMQDKIEGSLAKAIIDSSVLYTQHKANITKIDHNNILQILNKLETSGISKKEEHDKMKDFLENHFFLIKAKGIKTNL